VRRAATKRAEPKRSTHSVRPGSSRHDDRRTGARTAIEALLDESVALKRVGILGYGATARAILAALQENDAYTFVWDATIGA